MTFNSILNNVFVQKKREFRSRFFYLSTQQNPSMRKFYKLLVMALFVVFSGCNSTSTSSQQQPDYFSLINYFENQKSLLEQENFRIKKYTSFNRELDSSIVDRPDWEKEFELFKDLDLNKPAFRNSFNTDTVQSDTLKMVQYTSNDQHTKVKFLEIVFYKNEVTQIHLHAESDNFVFSSRSDLWYFAKLGYKVSGSQNVLGFSKKEYWIEAKLQK